MNDRLGYPNVVYCCHDHKEVFAVLVKFHSIQGQTYCLVGATASPTPLGNVPYDLETEYSTIQLTTKREKSSTEGNVYHYCMQDQT